MCLNLRGKTEMDISAARDLHQSLLGRLMTGAGGIDCAMHRAERLYGLPYWAQANLRHKKRASTAFIERLRQAYLSVLETSVRRDLEKLKAEQAKDNNDAALANLMAEAAALLAKIEERV